MFTKDYRTFDESVKVLTVHATTIFSRLVEVYQYDEYVTSMDFIT